MIPSGVATSLTFHRHGRDRQYAPKFSQVAPGTFRPDHATRGGVATSLTSDRPCRDRRYAARFSQVTLGTFRPDHTASGGATVAHAVTASLVFRRHGRHTCFLNHSLRPCRSGPCDPGSPPTRWRKKGEAGISRIAWTRKRSCRGKVSAGLMFLKSEEDLEMARWVRASFDDRNLWCAQAMGLSHARKLRCI